MAGFNSLPSSERFPGWLLCCLLALLSRETRGIKDLYKCPPSNNWYKSQAYRIPLPGTFLPVLSSMKPGDTKAKVAILPIHGARREQENYFSTVLNGAVKKNEVERGSTVVIAPAFQRKPCYSTEWPPNNDVEKVPSPTWNEDDGVQPYYTGNNGSPSDEIRMSSFVAMDEVVKWTITSYPNVKLVLVTGFSAGSQMALNWGIMSPVGSNGVVTLGGSQVHLRIVVQSPGSVTYIDHLRPATDCVPLKDTGPYHTCNTFEIPPDTCGTPNQGAYYDNYKWGTAGFEDGGKAAKEYPTVQKYLKDTMAIGSNGRWSWGSNYQQGLKVRYGTKDIHYQVGAGDTKNCVEGTCAGQCAPMTTGTNRLQRMQNFAAYIEHIFPESPTPLSLPFGIFDGSHQDYQGFESPFFSLWAFQQPFANPPPATFPDTWVVHEGLNCYNGKGAEQILINSFSLIVSGAQVCKEYCQQQRQPLCEGVVMRSDPNSKDCWMVTDVNVQKCQKNNKFTFHHLTFADAKGTADTEVFAFHAYEDEVDRGQAAELGQVPVEGPRLEDYGTGSPGTHGFAVGVALVVLAIIGCGFAMAQPLRKTKRKPSSRRALVATEMAADGGEGGKMRPAE